MAVVEFPEELGIRAMEWTLDQPAQVNSSPYTGARAVAASPWHGKWSARVELAAMDAKKGRLLKAFVVGLRGQVNSFRLSATTGEQKGMPAATVGVTAAKGATSMTLSGAQMQPGQMVTVNDQLLQLTAVADGLITFQPALRAQATAGTAVETGDPTCFVSLTDSSAGWGIELGPIYSASFDVEEVF